ncbi:11375_t:CDS:2 [Funneliformis geosporum]|nr:11375_t:CDS:2 [Funneliformis geosporum]
MGITLHICSAILSDSSEVFDSSLYIGLKGRLKQISFPKIESCGMEIMLEYIYTERLKNYKNNRSPELLSKSVDLMDIIEDSLFLNLLVEAVSSTPLGTFEFAFLKRLPMIEEVDELIPDYQKVVQYLKSMATY